MASLPGGSAEMCVAVLSRTMNDLLQLNADMRERYADVVQKRKSLKDLKKVVCALAQLLEKNAGRVIRPDNAYWAVLSNAVAGAVEQAKALLAESADVAAYHPAVRVTFFWCLAAGLDSDIKEIRHIFCCILNVARMKENRNHYHDKVKALRKVNTLGLVSGTGGLHRTLSNIKEEAISSA